LKGSLSGLCNAGLGFSRYTCLSSFVVSCRPLDFPLRTHVWSTDLPFRDMSRRGSSVGTSWLSSYATLYRFPFFLDPSLRPFASCYFRQKSGHVFSWQALSLSRLHPVDFLSYGLLVAPTHPSSCRRPPSVRRDSKTPLLKDLLFEPARN